LSKMPPFDKIANEMYEAAARSRDNQTRRSYLGMSAIGDPCARKLWLSFRGYTPLPLDGRILMLFRFGDRVEEEIIYHLRLAGYSVEGQQESFSDHDGWFKGHCDGIIHGVTRRQHILEIKSCNANKFKAFQQYGIQKTYQVYYDQAICYCGYAGLERALFVIQNKNNSEIYTERVYFDSEVFEALKQKAYQIITANDPAPQSFTEDSQTCGWCDHRVTCWMPSEAIQTLRDCMTCEYLKWIGLVRSCLHKDHPYEIKQRIGVCGDFILKNIEGEL